MGRCPVVTPRPPYLCTKEIPDNRVMCGDDWKRVPYKLQTDVWKHYVRGQNALTASKEYKAARLIALEAAAEARKEEHERKQP